MYDTLPGVLLIPPYLTSHFNFPSLKSALLPEGLQEAITYNTESTGIAQPQKQRI